MIEQAVSRLGNFLGDLIIAPKPYLAEDPLIIVDDAGWPASAKRAVKLIEQALASLDSAIDPFYVLGRRVMSVDPQIGGRMVVKYFSVDPADPSARVFLKNNRTLLRRMQENESSIGRIPKHLDNLVRLI